MELANGDSAQAGHVGELHAGAGERTSSKRRASASKPRSFYGDGDDDEGDRDQHAGQGQAAEEDSELTEYDSDEDPAHAGKAAATAGKRPRNGEGGSSEDAAAEQRAAAVPQTHEGPAMALRFNQPGTLGAGHAGLSGLAPVLQGDDVSKSEQPADAAALGPQPEAALGPDGQPLPVPPGMMLPDFMLGCYRCRFAPVRAECRAPVPREARLCTCLAGLRGLAI